MDNVRKLGNFITPDEFYREGAELVPQMKAVLSAILWDDGTVTAGWTNCKTSELCLMKANLDLDVLAALERTRA